MFYIPMPSVLVDIEEADLRVIEKVAKENHRSRKAQIELVIHQHRWLKEDEKK